MFNFTTKRAQVQTQIFTYIIATVVLIVIFIFGFRTIKNFKENVEEVELAQLQTYLKSEVKKIQSDYGSTVIRTLNIPSEYSHICFAQDDSNWEVSEMKYDLDLDYTIIYDSLVSRVQKNVFLYPSGVTSFYIGNICIEDCESTQYKCVAVNNGAIRIGLEGLGDRVKVFFL